MDTGLRKKVVVITGGTRGIGYAAAELFLREGACVAVCGSNEKLVAPINARAEQTCSSTTPAWAAPTAS